jgi:hypothetical protein
LPARGYKSVTVGQKYYDDFKEIADKKHMPVAKLAEWLIEQYSRPYIRALIDEVATKKRGFEVPYQDFVLDPKIKDYKSTAWVRSEDYVKQVGFAYLVIEDRVRHDDEFKAERVFIVSQNSWDKKEVWKMIGEWLIFRFLREEQFKIFVLREKIADKILTIKDKDDQQKTLTKYYDMGIYAEARDKPTVEVVVGYLEINPQSRPGEYARVSSLDNPKEIKDAERYFAELEKHAQIIENAADLEKLEKQSYDENVETQ